MPPPLAALLLVLLVTGALWSRQKVNKLNEFDQPFYLGIAHDLAHEGRFTDGFMFADKQADGKRPSGMRFAPLYPGILAAASSIDGGLREGMDCLVASAGRDDFCNRSAPSVRALQFCELAAFFWLVWWLGAAVGGANTAWLSLVLALCTAPLLLRSVNYLMTEMTCLVLTASAMAAAVRAAQRREYRLRWSFAAGALLALAALTRPAFLYLIPACAIGVLVWGRRRGAMPVLAMVLGAACLLSPWILRNVLVMGRPALTHGYDSHTLVQRIAFDTMSWREYGLAYLCWLPDGNELGRLVFGAGACDRFGWDEHSNSFYVLGLRHMLPETLAASGGYAHHLGYLLHTYVFRMPLKHVLVTIPLALRGAYVAHWWGVWLGFCAAIWTVLAMRRPARDDVFLLVALPAWFMLWLNASVAVNQVRYNLMLIPCYAIAGALTCRWAAMHGTWWSFVPKWGVQKWVRAQ